VSNQTNDTTKPAPDTAADIVQHNARIAGKCTASPAELSADTAGGMTSTNATPPRHELSLAATQSCLALTCKALNGWKSRQTTEGHTYVSDGHTAITALDEPLCCASCTRYGPRSSRRSARTTTNVRCGSIG